MRIKNLKYELVIEGPFFLYIIIIILIIIAAA